ncbi:hypothetical protein A11S_31 [Micavibrio aeruginosavorus EPB]|uniref:Uncharacterized protein n=1 Tax=Micavibrio aeruginosavorus EPB TaxID=349215 RepID=M4VUI1_9BACT|nr:hypothetical protein A11S_31 [Micavibrio aeruginosavorus EPB]
MGLIVFENIEKMDNVVRHMAWRFCRGAPVMIYPALSTR